MLQLVASGASSLVYTSEMRELQKRRWNRGVDWDILPAPLQAAHSAGVRSRTPLTGALGTFIKVAALRRDCTVPHFPSTNNALSTRSLINPHARFLKTLKG